jgi:hypothetical protein
VTRKSFSCNASLRCDTLMEDPQRATGRAEALDQWWCSSTRVKQAHPAHSAPFVVVDACFPPVLAGPVATYNHVLRNPRINRDEMLQNGGRFST